MANKEEECEVVDGEERRKAGLAVAFRMYPNKPDGYRSSLVIDWDNQPGRYFAENAAIDIQVQLTRATGLLESMYHPMGHLMITPKWLNCRRALLTKENGSHGSQLEPVQRV
jgi:hypothetical protein